MRKNLLGIICGAVVSTAILAGCLDSCRNQRLIPELKRRVLTSPESQRQSANYDLVRGYSRDFTDSYLTSFRKTQPNFEDAIKKHGYEKMFGVYDGMIKDSLEYAAIKIVRKTTAEEDEKQFREIAKRFTSNMNFYNVSTPINYQTEKVVSAYVGWARFNTIFFERVLKSRKRFTDFRELFRQTFTEDESKQLVEEQDRRIVGIYDSFVESRTGIKGLFAERLINYAREETRDFYRSALNELCSQPTSQPK
ncbi:MAG: hypothetical protein KKE50_05945 [Nanoarchaeota archaeon]|nr:hypothetical protein [Nanoarchaeota archaeon]